YALFSIALVVGMANAVNLTDGLDGLAAGSVAIAGGALAVIAARAGAIPAGVLSAALAGATLGFLWFNAHPARVFMGDVGSQGCGAALAVVGTLAKMELWVLIVGGLFVWEALSVFLQVASFKTTCRRRKASRPRSVGITAGWVPPRRRRPSGGCSADRSSSASATGTWRTSPARR